VKRLNSEERVLPLVRLFALTIVAYLLGPSLALGVDDWQYDVIHLKDGKIFRGLLVSESSTEVRFRCVRRNPGTATVVIFTTFARKEVESIERLVAKDREILEARLKALDPTGKGEASRMEGLDLERVPWVKGGEAFRYVSAHFVVVSNAREDIVRRAAVRLEEIDAAFARFLPPRRLAGKPTTIYLVRSLAEFQELIQDLGTPILQPAFYHSGRNQIYCASDLQRLGDRLEKIRKDNQEILNDVKESEANLNKYYKGKIPPAIKKHFDDKRQEVLRANQQNDRLFKEATRQLFQTLYHEAFHAYLANFVYSPDEAEVPRWLNEGLAQIFETAIVEAGELRVGHADPGRLDKLKAKLRHGQFLPMSELLRARSDKFLVNHGQNQFASDRYYLHSWALAFYLTFDRNLLGTLALDQYVQAIKRGTDPLKAFQQLVGEPLPQFENEFHEYLRRLRMDGTAANIQGKGNRQ
jgi:hypothetical protein